MTEPRKIMVVDDSRDNLMFFTEVLNNAGFKVLPALNGRLALNSLNHTHPDLLLLDLNMPEMSGFEVCQAIRSNAQFDDLPIVFISGSGVDVQAQAMTEYGGSGILQKPFTMQELISAVDSYLN